MFSFKTLLPGAATIGAGFLALVVIVPVLFGLMAASGACAPVSDDGGGDVGDIGDIDPNEKAHAKAVFDVLSEKGMSNTNIAGILGNWSQESGVDPTSIQGVTDSPYKMTPKKREKAKSFSGGIGLGQWTADRNSKLKAYAKTKNKDWWTVELQLTFMADPKGDNPKDVAIFEGMIKNELDSVSAATKHFHDKWERAGAPNMPNRIKQADKWFKEMKNWTAGSKAQAAGTAPSSGEGEAIAGGSVTGQKKKKLPLGDVKPHVQEAAEVIHDEYDGITGVGGYRSGGSSRDPNGHPAGLAVDFMVPLNKDGRALGDDIAKFVIDNHKALNVKYVIWYQRIYNVERPDDGWRDMDDRGDDTQNHKDHPHVSFQAEAKGDPKDAIGKGGKGGGSDDSDDGNADNVSCTPDGGDGGGGGGDVPDDGRTNPGPWGGHKNGEIPTEELKKIPWTPDSKKEFLRKDATEALIAMNKAYKKKFNTDIGITDAYRDFEEQEILFKKYGPGRAAVPGKSNHGWALAVDYGGGINKFGSPQHKWMQENAKKYGWEHPPWAREGQKNAEAWHWEYYGKDKESKA